VDRDYGPGFVQRGLVREQRRYVRVRAYSQEQHVERGYSGVVLRPSGRRECRPVEICCDLWVAPDVCRIRCRHRMDGVGAYRYLIE
jgi:hypothetical protein